MAQPDVAVEQIHGVAIGGKCVGLRKRTITPRPDPTTGELKPSFDKYEVVIEAEGATFEIGFRDEREARRIAGSRDAQTGYLMVPIGSARGGAGGRVYWNGGDDAGSGSGWLEI